MRGESEKKRGNVGRGSYFIVFYLFFTNRDNDEKKTLLQSVFHVAHLRGLFPDSVFKSVTMANLDGKDNREREKKKKRTRRQRAFALTSEKQRRHRRRKTALLNCSSPSLFFPSLFTLLSPSPSPSSSPSL